MSTSAPALQSAQTIAIEIRRVLAEFGRLSVDATDDAALSVDADLYALGLTSHASVTVMLGCEDAFDIEFPERMLTKATFASINSIVAAVAEVGAAS